MIFGIGKQPAVAGKQIWDFVRHQPRPTERAEDEFVGLDVVNETAREAVESLMDTPEEYQQLVQQFFCDGEILMDGIRTSLARRDAVGLRKACHKLKGSCASLGSVRMAEVLNRLEIRACSELDDDEAARCLADRLCTEWTALHSYFQRWAV